MSGIFIDIDGLLWWDGAGTGLLTVWGRGVCIGVGNQDGVWIEIQGDKIVRLKTGVKWGDGRFVSPSTI